MSKLHQIQFLQLVEKYLEGTASVEEVEFLEGYYHLLDDGPEALERIGKEKFAALEAEFKLNIDSGIQLAESPSPKIRLYQQWKFIAGIAAAVAAIVFGVWFLTTPRHLDDRRDLLNSAKNDLAPGKQGATLTLANGKQIRLTDASNGQLAKEAGVTITKTANGQVLYSLSSGGEMSDGQRGDKINTLSTAKGETYVVTLPDKSKVWLNALSSITYSASLNERGLRRVRLEGEAYFEVAKDKTHPFVVQTAKQEVEVLGTHFNINSYSDEPAVATTLLEGSVRVASLSFGGEMSAGQRGAITLKPNQQSLNTGTAIKVGEADPSATAWVQGKFRFDNTSLENVMKQLARWYNVEVVYKDGIPDRSFTGDFDRNNNLSAVLKVLKIMKVNFKIEGRKLIVSK